MKLTIRIDQGTDEFQVDAEPSDTIGDLKRKIHASQGFSIESQSILFCARVPADDMTLEASRITDKAWIIVLVSKPRPPLPVPTPVDISEFRRPSAQEGAASSVIAPPDASSEAAFAPVSTSIFDFILDLH